MKPLVTVAALLALAGCSSAEPVEPATDTVTETATATETEAGPTVTETVTETATPKTEAAEAEGDPTEQFLAEYGRERWADKVIEVTRDSNSVQVRTTIVDPRGRDGSPAASEALDVCRAALDLFDPGSVRVMEADDSTFAHAGIDGPECVEY